MARHMITLNAGFSSSKFGIFELDRRGPSALAVGLMEMVGEDQPRRIKVHDCGGANDPSRWP